MAPGAVATRARGTMAGAGPADPTRRIEVSSPYRRVNLILACTLAGAGVAQNQFVLPLRILNRLNESFPFGGQTMRYQQWYSANEWMSSITDPHRITGLEFKAGNPAGQAGRIVEVEVTMANSFATGPSSAFEANMVSGRTVVLPRRRIQLGTAMAGTWPVSFTFVNEFHWDGQSGVVVEIKLFDNGNNNQPYAYELEKAISTGNIVRLFTIGDPNASTALVFTAREGLTTRFTYKDAISYPYGTGCTGEGGHIPVAGTINGLPMPGNMSWMQTLTNAPARRQAFFIIGLSKDLWAGSVPLPHELIEIQGFGCFLRADPAAYVSLMTTGGGPGTGAAQFNLPIPPDMSLVGGQFYSQWLILDPNAVGNGVLAVTSGLAHRIGAN
jgi:hypothetical protein